MKRILLPTDFSENALNASRYALQLFEDVEASFFLLHTYLPPVYHTEYLLHSPSQIGLGDIYQTNANTEMEEFKGQLEKEFKNSKHTLVTITAFNSLVDEVREVIEKEEIDLVVMGTKGATGAREYLFGSHTVHVLNGIQSPVLAIPSDFEFEKPKEILFPADFEIDYDEDLLGELFDIAKMHLSNISVFHVDRTPELTEKQEENKKVLASLLKDQCHLFHHVADNEIIPAINEYQLKQRIHLLVMVKNKHTFFERLFLKPIIKKISFNLEVPFLVIPQPSNEEDDD